jgi:BirA family transcriptional regulator, biotin operon repressor / biotin---[acetyl-CoA-carboxylase] ligase
VTVALFDCVGSTMDVAHHLGESGAPDGTVVLADRQTAGRGQHGRSWSSEPGAGVWLTLLERPADASGLEALSVRLGLRVAQALDAFAGFRVRVKPPNDLYTSGGKLGGILCEARWHGERVSWVAVGLGVNTAVPAAVPGAAALPPGTSRIDVIAAVVPAMRAGVSMTGGLSAHERHELLWRDIGAEPAIFLNTGAPT